MIVYLCSSNTGKLTELSLAASGSDLEILPLPRLKELTPPEETGTTFEANASLKACYYSQFTSELVVADDSGLEVDALGGAPGIFSARFAGPNASDDENNALLLKKLRTETVRTARFVCVVAVSRRGECLSTMKGQVEGEILEEHHGSNGFGYDPLFFYPPLHRAFAELTPEEKLAVSHRGKAMRGMLCYLTKLAFNDRH